MRTIRRTVFALIFLLTFLTAAGYAQKREAFRPLEGGFQYAHAVEKDETPSILVLFPDEYLKDDEARARGIIKSLPLILGCSYFEKCAPKIGGAGMAAGGRAFQYVDTIGPVKRIHVFYLGSEDRKIIGVVLMPGTIPKEQTF